MVTTSLTRNETSEAKKTSETQVLRRRGKTIRAVGGEWERKPVRGAEQRTLHLQRDKLKKT